ncbi:TNF receptor-associated factor 6 [Eurytemora carolleeae]|uniref:TNF receptor-associated factor 6 n=1 Tax=Eurytemora carolleeae TaxID=1294199 RepID=UPI000C78B6C0|nr:TNF receptor-associated factor 6 [Eurytemora carolleeae]|eukprot:XP_023326657.1 TNF receptor-associated factor 6-like [Eurytemora affinis]
MKVADREAHVKICSFKTNKYTDDMESLSCTDCGELISLENQHSNIICPRALVACPFSLVGCSQKIQRSELQEHVRSQISHHMQLMAEKLLKIQQQQSAVDCCYTQEYPEALAASPNCSSVPGSPRLTRNQEFRVSGSNLQNNTKLLRECFQRLIQTEQKNCQLQIRLEHLESLINQNTTEKEEELKGKLCNGKFVWKISGFASLYQKMVECPSFVIYSRPFYSSVYGYKMCLRCNITLQNGEQHLGVFLHLMQGENDDSVFWPFQGSIFLTILNQGQGLHRENVSEHLESDPALGAFQKPNSFRNLRGFGFQEFVRLNSLLAGGFIKNDTLIIKADVTQHEEV